MNWLTRAEDAVLSFLRSPPILRLVGAVVALAAGVRHALPPEHPWATRCGLVCGIGAALGVYGMVKPSGEV